MLVLCKCFNGVAWHWASISLELQGLGADGNPRLVKTWTESPIKEYLGSWTMHPPVVVTTAGIVWDIQHSPFLRGKCSMGLLQQLNAEGEPSSIKGSQDFAKGTVFQCKEHCANLRCGQLGLGWGTGRSKEGFLACTVPSTNLHIKICTSLCSWWILSVASKLAAGVIPATMCVIFNTHHLYFLWH